MYYLLKCIKFLVRKNKTLKKYWKMEKNTGKVREFCQPGKVGTLKVLQSRHPSRPLTEPRVTAESPDSPRNHQVSLQLTSLNVSRRRFTVSERKSGELAIIAMCAMEKKQNVKVLLC